MPGTEWAEVVFGAFDQLNFEIVWPLGAFGRDDDPASNDGVLAKFWHCGSVLVAGTSKDAREGGQRNERRLLRGGLWESTILLGNAYVCMIDNVIISETMCGIRSCNYFCDLL